MTDEEAADEYMTRRLKEVGGSMTVADYCNESELSTAFLAGCAKVRAELETKLRGYIEQVTLANKAVDEFEEENQALREALEHIGSTEPKCAGCTEVSISLVEHFHHVANFALSMNPRNAPSQTVKEKE